MRHFRTSSYYADEQREVTFSAREFGLTMPNEIQLDIIIQNKHGNGHYPEEELHLYISKDEAKALADQLQSCAMQLRLLGGGA